MKATYPRTESRTSRTSAAILLALFTFVSPLSPLFASAAQAQGGGARRPATGGSRAGQQPDKGGEQVGEGVSKSPDLAAPAAVTAAQLKVTLDDGVGVGGSKRPGETITYTATIQNTSPTDAATNVKFINDLTANLNLTFVAGSVQTQPIARADAFDVLGNVRIDVPQASGLLANDFDPDTGGNSGLTITTAPTTSARGGEVSINTTTGAFTYNPPAGYDGADSFSYTVTDATGKTDTATAAFTVANMIWFIQSGATACTSRAAGCGRLSNPFSDLQSFQAAQGGVGANNGDTVDPEAGDNIFLYTGNANYTGPLTLLNTQKLIGQGASDTLATIAGVTPPAHSDPLPTTNEPSGTNPTPPTITSAATGILLAADNTLRGFNVGAVGAAQAKIQGTNFGTLTIGKAATGERDVNLSGAGRIFSLTTGAFAATSGINSASSTGSSGDAAIFLSGITAGALSFVGVTVAGAAAEGIEVTGSSADISFGSTDISAGTNGVVLANNPAGTRTFGALTISGGSGIGFQHFDPDGAGAAVGGGAVSVTGAMNVINPAGNGIDIQNSNANLSFAATTVSKGSTSNIGVNLVNNATRTIAFTQLSSTTTNAFALEANNSGTVTSGGGSLTQNGAGGGGAASLVNTALGLSFNSVSSNVGANGIIFIVSSGTFTSGTTNLQNNAGLGLLVSSSSVAANFGNTTVTGSAGDGVELTSNSGAITFADLDITPDAGLRAFDALNNTGTITSTSGDIAATGAPAVVIAGPAGRTPLAMVLNNVDSTNSATTGVDLDRVSGNLTVNDATLATNVQNPTGTGIQVSRTASGTINFGNTTVNGSGNANGDDTGTGILLTSNAGAITFGALTLTPDTGERGLFATDTDATAAGAITVASGTVTTTNDTAVDITGQAVGNRTPLNIQLQTVNTTGGGVAPNGIKLVNTSATGSPGGFRVLGTGGTCTQATTTCTGGQIANTSSAAANGSADGNGIYLQNADNARFTRIRVNDHVNGGIRGINVNVFVLDTSITHGTNGNEAGGPREGSLTFDGNGQTPAVGMIGNSAITNCDIRGGFSDQVYIDNSSGRLDLTVTNSQFHAGSASNGNNDNFAVESDTTADVFLSITGSTFGETDGESIDFTLVNTGDLHATVTNNTFTGNNAAGNRLGQGLRIFGASWNGVARYNVSNNTITGVVAGGAIHMNKGSGTGDMQGTIFDNTIGNAAVVNSGATQSSGIRVEARGAGGQHTALVSNNDIHQINNQGILLEVGEDGDAIKTGPAAALNATVIGNTIDTPGAAAQHGIYLNAGLEADGTDNNPVCADIGDPSVVLEKNTVPTAANEAPGQDGFDVRLRRRFATRVEMPGYTGGPHDSAALNSYATARNVLTSVSSTSLDDASLATDGYFNTPGGAPCAQPAAATPPNAPATNAVLNEGEEKLIARQSQSLVIPGVMITQQQPRQQQQFGQTDTPAAPQPVAQVPAQQPKAQSEKSSAAQGSKGGETKSKKGEAGKIGVAQPRAATFEVNIGTLPANDSVTLTFQVTISPTLTPAAANTVTNQGTVTADGINKVSDDPQTTPPAAGEGSDATVTPIDKFEPAIDVASGDTTTNAGESVTFTATLGLGTAPGIPAPTGTVNFVDQTDANSANWETLCSNVAVTAGGTAECATTNVDAGTRTVAAVYSGDGRYDPATDTVTQTVTACSAALTVTSVADDGSAGTLRHAITNACAGATITFDINAPTVAGPHTITLNSASGELAISKNLTITGPLTESVAVSGGTVRALHITAGTVNISNLTVSDSDPAAVGAGGGLLVEGATSIVTLYGMTFTGNSAQGGTGGAIAVANDATLNVINTTVSGNTANAGGGIENGLAVLNLVNVTITNNDANLGNVATPGAGQGGGVLINAGVTNVRNSIVTGNLGSTGEENFSGTPTDQGNNLIGVAAGISPTLASNGGPTQTHALLAGSAALDAGNNCVLTAGGCVAGPPADPAVALTTDQRGFDRAADAADADTTDTVDIGAFEAQASVAVFADASIAADSAHTVTDFSVGDADSNLTVTATSDNQTLVPNANAVVTAGSSADKRTLTVTPAAGQTGTANITVTVTDPSSGTSMSDTFLLTVSALASPTVTITEDNPDPSNSGGVVTVKFTVTGGAGTATGNVVITASGGTETCTASVATAQCDITLVGAGSRTLTATYSGDGTYAGGTDTEPHVVFPNVTVSDARASEASQLAVFTVHLSVPSTDIVTVNFTTADEPALTPGAAVAGQDYTSRSDSVVFAPGQTLQTISVPVTDDGLTGEPDETFLLNLTGAVNANVTAPPADSQATGTITEAPEPAGSIIISEIRTSGPGASGTGDLEDDFVELYNNSDSPVTVPSGGWGIFQQSAACSDTPVLIATVPGTVTVIPARGHYLVTGAGYSLTASAGSNQPFALPLQVDRNVGIFSTPDLAQLSAATRLDAVGFGANVGGNCDLLREGANLPATNGSAAQHSFYRRLGSGRPQDTNASAASFHLVSTDHSAVNGSPSSLGAPGPENMTSPVQRNDKIKASLIDPMQSAGAEPNSVRKFCSPMTPGVEECDPSRSQHGTFSIRRRWTNNTGADVTTLRFRLVNVTTGPTPAAGTADLRAISSLQVTGVPLTGGGTVTVEGTTLEAPTQALGGGFNSTLAAGTISTGAPLAPGASVNLQFLLGVQQPGAYQFFVNVEAGPPPSGVITPATKGGAQHKTAAGKQQ